MSKITALFKELKAFATHMRIVRIDPIFLLALTLSHERIKEAVKIASGYIYYVSMRDVTGRGIIGAFHLNTQNVASVILKIREEINIPIAVGFEISDAVSAKAVSIIANTVVISSRIIRFLKDVSLGQAVQSLKIFVREIRDALDS